MAEVLVAYATKMQGTAAIAQRIAAALRSAGLAANAEAVGAQTTLDGKHALVAGSAIYNGAWRPEMVDFLEQLAHDGSWDGPVWLFHSGPLGDDQADEPQPLPKKVEGLAGELGANGVRTFGGRLVENPRGLMARVLARRLAGDWRDFDDVDEWAAEIAKVLVRKPSIG